MEVRIAAEPLAEAKVVHRWPRSEREEYRATLTMYLGQERADIRVFKRSGEEWHPTKRGIQVSPADVPQLVAAVTALAEAVDDG